MIAQGDRSIGTVPFSSFRVGLLPHFEDFSFEEIRDTFEYMAEVLTHLENVVWKLREKSDGVILRQHQIPLSEARAENEGFVRDCNSILPLIQTQVNALTMTARALAEGIDEKKVCPGIVVPGERKV